MLAGDKEMKPHKRYMWNWLTVPEKEPPANAVPTRTGAGTWVWGSPINDPTWKSVGVTSSTCDNWEVEDTSSITCGGHAYPLKVLKQTTIDTFNEYWLSSKHPELGWQKK